MLHESHVRAEQCCGVLLQANDIAMLADMARYMHNDYSSVPGYTAANFPHANLPSLFWWDWNANSGDTGGLVQDDWLTVRTLAGCRPLSISESPSSAHPKGTLAICHPLLELALSHSGCLCSIFKAFG